MRIGYALMSALLTLALSSRAHAADEQLLSSLQEHTKTQLSHGEFTFDAPGATGIRFCRVLNATATELEMVVAGQSMRLGWSAWMLVDAPLLVGLGDRVLPTTAVDMRLALVETADRAGQSRTGDKILEQLLSAGDEATKSAASDFKSKRQAKAQEGAKLMAQSERKKEDATVAEKSKSTALPIPQLAWYTKAARRLPLPTAGAIKEVHSVSELLAAVNGSPAPGTTILVHDGTYAMSDLLWLNKAKNVALRGFSDDRSKVILDASHSKHEDMLWIAQSDGVLVADMTFQNSRVHGITVKGESDTQHTQIYNCVFHNIWERKIKGTSAAGADGQPAKDGDAHALETRPANGRIEYCLFYDDQKKNMNDFAGGDYIAGIDMMWLKNWVISDNVFMNIQGKNGQGRGAVFLWNNSEDVTVERNLIINCDRGICLGNPSGALMHMSRGIVRNNMIIRGADAGIEICRTTESQVYNNTVWGKDSMDKQAIHVFQGKGNSLVFNNLVRGAIWIDEPGSKEDANTCGDLAGYFKDSLLGDLHLTPPGLAAVHGHGAPTPKEFLDWDGGLRPLRCDVGADEVATSVPSKNAAQALKPPTTDK